MWCTHLFSGEKVFLAESYTWKFSVTCVWMLFNPWNRYKCFVPHGTFSCVTSIKPSCEITLLKSSDENSDHPLHDVQRLNTHTHTHTKSWREWPTAGAYVHVMCTRLASGALLSGQPTPMHPKLSWCGKNSSQPVGGGEGCDFWSYVSFPLKIGCPTLLSTTWCNMHLSTSC